MPWYKLNCRIKQVGPIDKIETVECADDQAAQEAAQKLADEGYESVEIIPLAAKP